MYEILSEIQIDLKELLNLQYSTEKVIEQTAY